MSTNNTPLEDVEQEAFVEWLELHRFKFTAVPNSTYTKSWKQKQKNKRTGLRAGFPDLIVLIPPDRSKDGEGYMLAIEMKRQKGGVMSEEQKQWAKALTELGLDNVQAYRADGFEAAKKVVLHYMRSN